MYPVNQVILGSEPMFNSLDDIDIQIQKMEAYRQRLKQLKESQHSQVQQSKSIWNEIDMEISPMSDDQKSKLMQDADYMSIYNELQSIVQNEILNLVKDKIENTENFIVDQNGYLYIIYAYGNTENTNKIDVIIFE